MITMRDYRPSLHKFGSCTLTAQVAVGKNNVYCNPHEIHKSTSIGFPTLNLISFDDEETYRLMLVH